MLDFKTRWITWAISVTCCTKVRSSHCLNWSLAVIRLFSFRSLIAIRFCWDLPKRLLVKLYRSLLSFTFAASFALFSSSFFCLHGRFVLSFVLSAVLLPKLLGLTVLFNKGFFNSFLSSTVNSTYYLRSTLSYFWLSTIALPFLLWYVCC